MSLEIKEHKKLLRKSLLQQIELLPEEYKVMADARIVQKLLRLPEYRQADTVFCFVGAEHEINTRPFLQQVLDDGKRLCVPLCVGRGIMEARRIRSLDELKRGHYGLFEPSPSAPIVPIHEVDFSIIPCLAADRSGNRLGHGGGYYDRLFGQYPNVKAAVICRGTAHTGFAAAGRL